MKLDEAKLPLIGINEKVMPSDLSWEKRLYAAHKAGYDFLEVSIDETDERLSRLDWSPGTKNQLKEYMAYYGVPILSMSLTGYSKYPIGSADKEINIKAMEIMKKAVQFSVDIGIRTVKLAGYDVCYEKSTEETKRRFHENLAKSAEIASRYGVMLALEPPDTDFMYSFSKAIAEVESIDSPWLQIYPDTGSITAGGLEQTSEIEKVKNHIIGFNIKNAKPNIMNKVPCGKGLVDFAGAFRTMKKMNFQGPFVIEMYNEEDKFLDIIKEARLWVIDQWNKSVQ